MGQNSIQFTSNLLDSHLVVDVRTPLEYGDDHLPGAINIPLLSNDERIEIGTIYKQTGPREARLRGLQLTAPRFPAIVDDIAVAAAGRPILVYCWRGGLRSKTVASILDLAGFSAVQLHGGYKAFRHEVTSFFESFSSPGPLVVIHGMTGIGKTTFLARLQEKGHAIVDLEKLACHRGSAFGELGLTQSLSQKRFDTLLWDAFRSIPAGVPVIIEGESRRIGRISLPGNLYDVMQQSIKVWCEAPLSVRVARLAAEYGIPEFRSGLEFSLERIKKRLSADKYKEIAGHLERWEMEPFMAGLVNEYYDKVYYRSREWIQDLTLSLEDFTSATEELSAFLRTLPR